MRIREYSPWTFAKVLVAIMAAWLLGPLFELLDLEWWGPLIDAVKFGKALVRFLIEKLFK